MVQIVPDLDLTSVSTILEKFESDKLHKEDTSSTQTLSNSTKSNFTQAQQLKASFRNKKLPTDQMTFESVSNNMRAMTIGNPRK